MKRSTILLAALSLGACSSIEQLRTTCAAEMGRPVLVAVATDALPGKPASLDPQVETCAQTRMAAQRAEGAAVAAVILAGAAAGAAAGASYRSSYRPYYHSHYRPYYRPSYRRW